jgi:hypothetical protein
VNSPDPLKERLWETGWEAHESAQRRRLAALSMATKLAWLEDAQRLVDHLTRNRSRVHGAGPAPPSTLG